MRSNTIRLLPLVMFVAACAQTAAPVAPVTAPQADTGVGYPTVAAALLALKVKPGAMIAEQSGWTVIADKEANTVWSFPPRTDPAYPSAVRRETISRGGDVYLKTNILCEAAKTACDKLEAQFRVLNERVKRDLVRPRPPGSQN